MGRKKTTVQLLLCLILAVAAYGSSFASSESRLAIRGLALETDEDLKQLERYFSQANSLDLCAIRERLYQLSYDELSGLEQRIQPDGLREFVRRIRAERLDIFLLPEGILIGNTPLLCGSPFYPGERETRSITAFAAHAERVYFDNLKLPYRNQPVFVSTEPGLWSAAKAGSLTPRDALPVGTGTLAETAVQLWSRALPSDYQSDFFVKPRQWIKRYQESLVCGLGKAGALLVRNEYSILALDAASGRELWSLGLTASGGRQAYRTYRHPHQNAYGYEMSLEAGLLFSELDGHLVAVETSDMTRPKLLWAKGLGEYTLASVPLGLRRVVLAALINSRGELWACGFDRRNGSLRWANYIGTSSFLSPACVISGSSRSQAFIATNHGVLVCLEPDTGSLLWIRAYDSRQYRLFDYWSKGHYQDHFLNKGSLEYDTQFLETGTDGRLYYKPRESDYLYILDGGSGLLQERLRFDRSSCCVLAACDGRVVVLEKAEGEGRAHHVEVVELATGKKLYGVSLGQSGALCGALSPARGSVLFKVGEALCLLGYASKEVSFSQASNAGPGWLVGFDGSSVFLEQDGVLSCRSVSAVAPSENQELCRFYEDKARVALRLKELLEQSAVHAQEEECAQLLEDAQRLRVPAQEISTILVAHKEALQDARWQKLVKGLTDIYAKEVITYNGVELVFINFMRGLGLLQEACQPSPGSAASPKAFEVRLGDAQVVPVEVVAPGSLQDWYLLLNFDQLLCIRQDGSLLWERRVFCGPIWESGSEQDEGRHLYSDYLKAYLYGNTLIINDQVNIIAVEAKSGEYLWSMTNKGPLFGSPEQLPAINAIWSFESSRFFVRHLLFQAVFFDDKLVVAHQRGLYAIDPATGFCSGSYTMAQGAAARLAVSGGRIYLLNESFDRIIVLDAGLREVASFSLDFLQVAPESWPDLKITPGHILLQVRPYLYLMDKESGELRDRLFVSQPGRPFLETCGSLALLIVPFKEVTAYQTRQGRIEEAWRYADEGSDAVIPWAMVWKKTRYYYLLDKKLLYFSRSNGEYRLTALDIDSGRQLWQSGLGGVKGFFYNLTGPITSGKELRFIISTTYTEDSGPEADILGRLVYTTSVDANSRLIVLALDSGAIEESRRLPAGGVDGLGLEITQSQGLYAYGLYGRLLQTEVK